LSDLLEAAFYDAVMRNDSTVLELGDETLKKIAHELAAAVRTSATIDWNLKESVRAEIRADTYGHSHHVEFALADAEGHPDSRVADASHLSIAASARWSYCNG
jgi:RNA:NAD 2'-phosphotransferase (TPT1/KptA family)